jgi:hypothetical protein
MNGQQDVRQKRVQLSCFISEKIKFVGVYLLFGREIHQARNAEAVTEAAIYSRSIITALDAI